MKNISDIVVSSRVRLARNAKDLPFGGDKLESEDAQKIVAAVYKSLGGEKAGYGVYNISKMEALDARVLKEKRLISEDLLHSKKNATVVLNAAETVSVMIAEEDLVRIQCIFSGSNLQECFNLANSIDDTIAKKIPFAFDERLGYLTSCPTNLGTGLRASLLMFLPALSIYNKLTACVNTISRFNMAIRGVYGEGSDSSGYLYQLSNQITLGLSEREILNNVDASLKRIGEAEIRARDLLLQDEGTALRDKIQRAYGTLLYAYSLESNEFMQSMALVKLGAYYDFIKISDYKKFSKLIIDAQPASLQSLANKDLSVSERDIFRASFVSKSLKAITK